MHRLALALSALLAPATACDGAGDSDDRSPCEAACDESCGACGGVLAEARSAGRGGGEACDW